jgi:hypothetical protein
LRERAGGRREGGLGALSTPIKGEKKRISEKKKKKQRRKREATVLSREL